MAAVAADMLTELGTLFTKMLSFVAEFVTALLGTGTGTDAVNLSPLLPLFLLGIAISLVMVITKLIRKVTWGA